jgi:diguanylate cyclase
MNSKDASLIRVLTWIAGVIALLVAILPPLMVWLLSERTQVLHQELEVSIKAERISTEIINRNPDLWWYELHRLEEVMSKDYDLPTSSHQADEEEERRSLYDLNGVLILAKGIEKVRWPVLKRTAPLYSAGKQVGYLSIECTQFPALKLTILAGLLGIVLSFTVFLTMRLIPLRALKSMMLTLQREEDNLRILVANALDAIISTNSHGEIESFNPSAEKIFGYSASEMIGQSIAELYVVLEDTKTAIQSKELAGSAYIETMVRHKAGNLFPVEFLCSKVVQGGKIKYVVILRDISDRKKAQENLARLANFDSLTGLPNRSMFRRRLGEAMDRANRNERLLVLMFLDLDRFKPINDTMGHAVGDQLLQAVGKRLQAILRKVDTVARYPQPEMIKLEEDKTTVSRLGGDEFTIILEGVTHISGATTAAQKVLEAFKLPFALSSGEVYISASIGITIFPFDDDDINILIKNADTAMYRSKEAGSNCFHFYREDMNKDAHERLKLEFHLRQALERKEFSLHYQPKLEFASGNVVGVEALLRWNNPELGSVSPIRFIPILEDNGMIVEVGSWVLRTACKQLRSWETAGMVPLHMAVNLSARQFMQSNIVEQIDEALSAAQLLPAQLEVEITESMLMEHSETIVAVLQQLKQRGIGIAIDDFGTGYSSLAYLKRFPLTTLKIDRSFVQEIASNEYDAAIAGAVIALARGLHLSVVAEGVETEAQQQYLNACGCHLMQGYFLSRPLPADEFAEWMKARG